MSVTQYIGARYVPLFATPEQWSSERAYEPLTIVLHEGNSYTSKQAVPIGIDIQNNEFWALTGNYNAQVEAYRQEVEQFDERITEAEQNAEKAVSYISESLKIDMFDGSGTNNYTTTLVQGDGAFILIDSGAIADNANIINWAQSLGVNKLDAFIITHMHNDHCQNFENIVNGLCDENTKIYKQMTPGPSNDEYDMFNTWNTQFSAFLQNKNYPSMIVPSNAETILFGNGESLKVTFFNTDESLKSAYDNSWANRGEDAYTTKVSSLNNYSLQVLFELNNSTYWESGDIEGEGQKQMARYARPVNVARNPHHFSNKAGWETYYTELNPDYWLVSNHFNQESEEIIDVGMFEISYLGRYLIYNSNNTPIITNAGNNVSFDILNGIVTEAKGHIVDIDYDMAKKRIVPHFAAIYPTDIAAYQDNPYFFMSEDFTLEYLHTTVRSLWNWANFPINGFYIPASTGYAGDSPFANTIRGLWANFEPALDLTNQVLYITMGRYGLFEFGWSSIDIPYSNIRVSAVSGNTATNYTFIDIDKGQIDKKIEGTFETDSNISSYPEWAYLSRSQILGAQLSPSGAVIPLIKTESPRSSTARHSGNLIFANGKGIYNCIVTQAGNIVFNIIDVETGQVTDSKDSETKISAIYPIV